MCSDLKAPEVTGTLDRNLVDFKYKIWVPYNIIRGNKVYCEVK
jgi:hypothetical protein